jgi:hypothetical protein
VPDTDQRPCYHALETTILAILPGAASPTTRPRNLTVCGSGRFVRCSKFFLAETWTC